MVKRFTSILGFEIKNCTNSGLFNSQAICKIVLLKKIIYQFHSKIFKIILVLLFF